MLDYKGLVKILTIKVGEMTCITGGVTVALSQKVTDINRENIELPAVISQSALIPTYLIFNLRASVYPLNGQVHSYITH